MQILIKRGTPEEIAEFFRKNRWLIERLLQGKADTDTVDHSPAPDHSDAASEEELEEEILETIDEIEEALDAINPEDIESEAARELLEDIEETIDEIEDILEGDDDEDDEEEQEDDLTAIKGLGPKTAEGLQKAGITTFQQLIDLTEEEIEELDDKITNFARSYESKSFREQAEKLK